MYARAPETNTSIQCVDSFNMVTKWPVTSLHEAERHGLISEIMTLSAPSRSQICTEVTDSRHEHALVIILPEQFTNQSVT
jgi:hypothetical protein